MFSALSDDSVWSDGLLIFYEIFKYLEANVPETILPLIFHRRHAFEKDLTFYLGKNWEKTYEPRKEVVKYVEHLQSLKERNPTLLVAYVYHLYMGLLSGGQLLQKKRRLAKNFSSSGDGVENGMAVTNFGDTPIHELKTTMRNLIDQVAQGYSDETKSLLIEESERVFQYNNTIIRTVKDVNKVNLRKFVRVSFLLFILYLMYKVFTT